MGAQIIEILRYIRNILSYFGQLQIFGVHIDFLFHFFVPFFLVLMLIRFLTRKRTVLIVVSFIVFKEVIDIFAKSRIEYIRWPGLDFLLDLAMGVLGLFAGLYLSMRIANKKQ